MLPQVQERMHEVLLDTIMCIAGGTIHLGQRMLRASSTEAKVCCCVHPQQAGGSGLRCAVLTSTDISRSMQQGCYITRENVFDGIDV